MPQWQHDPELKKRQLDQIKQAIEADGDGQISAKEFNIATQRLGLHGFIMQELGGQQQPAMVLGGQQQPAMVLMAQPPPMVNVMNVGQVAQTAVTEPDPGAFTREAAQAPINVVSVQNFHDNDWINRMEQVTLGPDAISACTQRSKASLWWPLLRRGVAPNVTCRSGLTLKSCRSAEFYTHEVSIGP